MVNSYDSNCGLIFVCLLFIRVLQDCFGAKYVNGITLCYIAYLSLVKCLCFLSWQEQRDQLDVVGPILKDTNVSLQFTEHQHLQLISVGLIISFLH